MLVKKKGYNVNLTRLEDSTVSLDERTTKANKLNADLFVSIHANSSTNPRACGVETYWTQSAQYVKNPEGLQADVMDSLSSFYATKENASKQLAHQIQNTLVKLGKPYQLINRHVKQKISQVLLGAEMPGALIEVGFISNKSEAKNLSDEKYQSILAEGITQGIEKYFSSSKKI